MNRSPRVLVVVRRYWPQANDSTFRLRQWCSAIVRAGAQVEVLTACWSSQWPKSLTCREIPIWRIEPAPSSPFRIGRYTRAVANWVREQASRFDLVWCDAVDIEAEAILGLPANASLPPVAVRFDPNELSATYCRDGYIASRALQACRRSRLVVAPRATALQRLISSGIPAHKIIRMPDSAIETVHRSDTLRYRARAILSEISPELFLRSTDRLVVCPTDLELRQPIETLLHAMGPLLETDRGLRLWLLGEGSYRSRIYESLKYRGWHNLVDMPGSFEDFEQIIQASDLWVFPTQGYGTGWLIPSAIASGLPILVTDSPEIGSVLLNNQSQLVFQGSDVFDLQHHIRTWIEQPIIFAKATERARQALVEHLRPLDGWDAILAHL